MFLYIFSNSPHIYVGCARNRFDQNTETFDFIKALESNFSSALVFIRNKKTSNAILNWL